MIEIKTYTEREQNEVIDLVLHCQNDGTRPTVTIDNQPELLRIREEYIDKGGNFWVAKEHGKVAGCIGIMNCGNGIAILKKFFVYEPYRSAPHHLGRRLYDTLLAFARLSGFSQIILDTPKNTVRAHKFYEKAGFRLITADQLPLAYHTPYEDNDFFCLKL